MTHRLSTYLRHTPLICIAAAMLVGCDTQETNDFSGMGVIHITATVDAPEPPDEISLTLTSADGRYSHTWDDISEFPELASYYTGAYRAYAFAGRPGSEGIDCPCYDAAEDFEVMPDATAEIALRCTLSQSIFTTSVHGQPSAFTLDGVSLHSTGHAYVDAPADTPVYLTPGSVEAFVKVCDDAGHSVTLAPDFHLETVRGEQYPLSVTCTPGGELTLSSGSAQASLAVSDAVFSTPSPVVTTRGFTSGETVQLTEGFPAKEPIVMTVSSGAPLTEVILSAEGYDADIPAEVNLLDASQRAYFPDLEVTASGSTCAVDFTRFIEQLTAASSSGITLRLAARDALGRVSGQSLLCVSLTPVEITLVSQTAAMIGVNVASAAIALNVSEIQFEDFAVWTDESWSDSNEQLPVISAWMVGDTQTMHLTFAVPAGNTSVPVRIVYRNTTAVHTTIARCAPDYAVSVDPFATTARLRVSAESRDVVSAVTTYARVYANGHEATVLSREPDNGIICISGLAPSTTYDLDTRVISGEIGVLTHMRTEAASQIPDGGFEDVDVKIKYDHLASGGVFSSTTFPIYNQQNYVDINVYWPQHHWASVNDKTFCRTATNRNTWYMQPSAAIDFDYYAEGSKSMRVTSVGWSLTGAEIPPYLQQEGSFLPYSDVIPQLDHRAAGRAFLGSYSFDPSTMAETYVEGVSFRSRPSSLNGYFRYVPDSRTPSDCGLLRVEIINDSNPAKPVIIASGEIHFISSPDFKSFNLPLQYHVYNMSATRLKLMFMSSDKAGDISTEDRNVPVTPWTAEAAFRGSSLWIDNLTFTY